MNKTEHTMQNPMTHAWEKFRDTEILEQITKLYNIDDPRDRQIAVGLVQVMAEGFKNGWDARTPMVEALLDALKDVDLRITQARLAIGIGKRTQAKRIEFLLSEMARIADTVRAEITKATDQKG